MPSPTEQYYAEDTAPNKSRRWLYILGGIVLVVLLGLFVKSTLPGQRAELVGRWKGTAKPGIYYDLRPDGTYESIIIEDWIGGNQSLRVKSSGKWKASKDALYLTTQKLEAIGKPRDKNGFKNEVKERTGRERKLPLEWDSPTKWHLQWGSSVSFERER
jgi:hypothetical protein